MDFSKIKKYIKDKFLILMGGVFYFLLSFAFLFTMVLYVPFLVLSLIVEGFQWIENKSKKFFKLNISNSDKDEIVIKQTINSSKKENS